MNIFYLDKDPVLSAKFLCNKHVVKMVTESAQMLCNCFNAEIRANMPITSIYEYSHVHHPCSLWVQASPENYEWLLQHGLALSAEYTRRYNKYHLAGRMLDTCAKFKNLLKFNHDGPTLPYLAMPAKYREFDRVKAYRAYYIGEKLGFAVWPDADVPEWIPSQKYMEARFAYGIALMEKREARRKAKNELLVYK